MGLFLLSIALIAWLPFQNGTVAVFVGSGALPPRIGQIIVLLKEIVLFALVAVVVLPRIGRPMLRVDIIFLLYVVWCAVYLPVGGLPIMARVTGMRMLVLPVLVYFLGRFVPVPRKGLAAVWGVLLIVYVSIAVLGLTEYLLVPAAPMAQLQMAIQQTKGNLDTSQETLIAELGGLFYSAFWAPDGSIIWVRRMMSAYLEPLALGHALILPLLFLFSNLVAPRAALLRPRWVIAALLVLLFIAQVLSLSRGAILATVIGLGVIGLMWQRTRMRSILLILLIVAGAMVVPQVRGYIAATLSLNDPSAQGHLYYFQRGLESVTQHPMGEGLGQGGYVEYQYASNTADFESKNEGFYFSVAGQVGIIGLALFAFGMLLLLLRVWKTLRKTRSRWLQLSALTVIGALMGHLVAAVPTDGAFGLLTSSALFFMAGMVVQLGLLEEHDVHRAKAKAA